MYHQFCRLKLTAPPPSGTTTHPHESTRLSCLSSGCAQSRHRTWVGYAVSRFPRRRGSLAETMHSADDVGSILCLVFNFAKVFGAHPPLRCLKRKGSNSPTGLQDVLRPESSPASARLEASPPPSTCRITCCASSTSLFPFSTQCILGHRLDEACVEHM